MKDWHIIPSRWGIDLVHVHQDEPPSSDEGWLCNRSFEGTWYCFNCGLRPPQEIEDVADLAGCWNNPESQEVTPINMAAAKVNIVAKVSLQK